ncbi:MAG: hypothetical protein KDA99_28025, partial [Planctomycetales bacterium]|nr:hypothetical protein [Planctomycetales bacterium]
MRFSDVIVAIVRHRWRIAVAVIVVPLFALLALRFWPRTYESEAKLLVRIGHENVTLDPTATTGETVMFQKQQEEEVNSVVEILNSRETVQRVVDALGPDEILKRAARHRPTPNGEPPRVTGGAADEPEPRENILTRVRSAAESALYDGLAWAGIADPISRRERAVRRLSGRLESEAARRSNVVSVRVRASSPLLAQRIVSSATNAFFEQHVKLSRTAGSHEFFQQQTERLHGQLTEASRLLKEKKNEYGLADIAGAREILLQELGSVELQTLDIDRQLEHGKARMAELQTTIVELPKNVVTSTTRSSNSLRDGMRQQLYDLEIREQELLARMNPQHPAVQQVRQQRGEIERILDRQPEERPETTDAPNPIRQDLMGDFLREQANYKALQKQQEAVHGQYAALQERIRLLNGQELEVRELQREVDTLETKYRTHVEKLEQARLDKEMQEEQISSINLQQPATYVEKPVSPNKQLVLMGSILLGGLLGIALAVVRDQTDQTVRGREQLERSLSLPVVASFPPIERRRREIGQLDIDIPTGSRLRTVLGPDRDTASASPSQARRAITVAVLNCDASKSKGSIASDLAMSVLRWNQQPVLLVDGDAQNRRVGNRFGINGAIGLADAMEGTVEIARCVRSSGFPNLSLLPAGTEISAQTMDIRGLKKEI